MTPEAKLKRHMVNGLTLHEAGRELGLSRRKVQALAKEHGLHQYNTRTGRPRTWDSELLDNAKGFLEDGASYREVERTLNIPRDTLSRVLPGYGWTKKESGEFGWLMRQMGGMV